MLNEQETSASDNNLPEVTLLGFNALRIDLRRKRQHYTRINNFVNKYIKMTLQWGSLAVMGYRCEQQILAIRPTFLALLLRPFGALLSALLRIFTDVYINPKAVIQEGLIIHNFAGIDLDPKFAGQNLTVNQNVCIGQDYSASGRPVIGDNVFVGAGAKILGAVTIGNNVVIAANSLVTKSIPDCCSVVGVPAQIVSRGVTSDYLSFNTD
jgi:serine O-acetyltransferase